MSENDPIPTRQEMFERCVRGLAGQQWRTAALSKSAFDILCVYLTEDGRRCGWGHVDHTAGSYGNMTVASMYERKLGLAGRLSLEDAAFAERLQSVHDQAAAREMGRSGVAPLQIGYVLFAEAEGLTWPADLAHPAENEVEEIRKYLEAHS